MNGSLGGNTFFVFFGGSGWRERRGGSNPGPFCSLHKEKEEYICCTRRVFGKKVAPGWWREQAPFLSRHACGLALCDLRGLFAGGKAARAIQREEVCYSLISGLPL